MMVISYSYISLKTKENIARKGNEHIFIKLIHYLYVKFKIQLNLAYSIYINT